ncbi:unnamed protein product [Prunus armeniaca]
MDNLYSMDDRLKRGGPFLLLEDAYENPIVVDEPMPEATSVIEPASISRCCIENGLFPVVPLFFQYPCGISKGWSKWIDRKLLDSSTYDILYRAQVLDAIFLSKLCDIHVEAKMLRHVVRRWSSETQTFICSWGEFTPTFEDVGNTSRLPVCGNWNPFDIALTPEDIDKLEVLQKGAPSFPSTSLRFSNWVFLWERLKGLDMYPLPYLHTRRLADSGKGSYMLNKLPLICRWFKRMQRKCQNFLKLLDSIQNFIFRPYGVLAEAFTYVPFYADVEGTVEVPVAMAQGCRFRKYALLNIAYIPLPTLGDSRSEISVVYSPHRVRRQFELDQGVPISLNHSDPFLLHRVF